MQTTLTTTQDTRRSLRNSQLALIGATFVILFLSAGNIARGAVSGCSDFGGIGMEKVTYQEFDSNAQDPRANPSDSSHHVRLRGWLYFDKTDSVADAPVIIYNHGHDERRGEPCAIARYFVGKGYVVFAPLRRGHDADGLVSTGIHIDRYVSLCMRSQSEAQADGGNKQHLFCSSVFCRNDVACSASQKDNAVEMEYLRSQRDDVEAQINYIQGRAAIGKNGKLADPNRVVILGHSFGGALIVFTNQYDYGQSAAIDISGGELSWGNGNPESEPNNPYWEIDLKDAMNAQQRPIYLLQPKNGRTLEPMQDLFKIAIQHKYRSAAQIFPNVPWEDNCHPGMSCWDIDTDTAKPEWQQAHENFINKSDQVEIWGPSVIAFIKLYPRS